MAGNDDFQELKDLFANFNQRAGKSARPPAGPKRPNYVLRMIVGLLLAWLFIVKPGAWLFTQSLWFNELGQSAVFWKLIAMRAGTGLSVGLLFFIIVAGNVRLARRMAPVSRVISGDVIELVGERFNALDRFIYPIVGLFAILIAFSASAAWNLPVYWLAATPFGSIDPIFGKDVSFYVFSLPFYRWVMGNLSNAIFFALITSAVVHLVDRAVSISLKGPEFAPHVKAHLSALTAALFLVKAVDYRFQAYDLLLSTRGVVFGAGYTDVRAILPGLTALSVVAVIAAAALLLNVQRKGWWLPAGAIGAMMVTWLIVQGIVPAIVQSYIVKPNEAIKERAYIARNIAATRRAFGLSGMKEQEYPADGVLNAGELVANKTTLENIRLWDTRPLLSTYSQIQTFRPYYTFRDIDVDRYTLDGKYSQVLLSARELDRDGLPTAAQTWVNRQLSFTHGNGLVMSPANESGGEGLPELLSRDVPPTVSYADLAQTSSRIYYGEGYDGYVVTKTRAKEFDYAKGDKNVYTVYDGKGGIRLDALRRFAFAVRYSDLSLLLTQYLTPQSRLLMMRDVSERLQSLAPFLIFDKDPYPVVLDGRILWVLDGFTTTDRYPYSQPTGTGGANYIRNSVKATVDAKDGTVTLYAFQPDEPMLRTVRKVFPKLIAKERGDMPAGLAAHVRYPETLFRAQAQALFTYHMTDPDVFYNKEDTWAPPSEIFDSAETPLAPYYVIMRLPGEKKEEFVLMMPFTPASRKNMIAWLAVRNDGTDYGKPILYKFPKDRLIFGPMQVEARIDQDTTISRQLTLWNQSGSRVIRGNMVVIPLAGSVLYVEPLYLRSEQSQIPELKKVVLAFGPKLVMADDLASALQRLFAGAAPALPAGQPAPAAGADRAQEDRGTTLARATQLYDSALGKLKKGDWAGFGQDLEALGKALEELQKGD